MPLNFPLNPAPGATHTFNGTTYTYNNSSWTATIGTSVGGGGGGTTIIEDSALKTKRIALYQAVGRSTTQVNFVNCSAYGQGVPTGKPTRYVPSATVYEKTDGVIYAQTSPAAYNWVIFELYPSQDTGFIPKRGFYLETTFGIHDIDSNAGHTFFAGFNTYQDTSNEWKTNILSVAGRNIGLGYDNNDTNWQIAVPKLGTKAGKVDTGIAKPTSNQQLFKAVFNVVAGSNIFNIKLYNASTNTLLFSYDITMQDNLDGDPALLRGYIPDYIALNFYQRLSSGVNSAKIGMMVSRLYAESAIV